MYSKRLRGETPPVRCGCWSGWAMGVHIGATWRMRPNRPCAAAMRPYAKLLWPLVIIIRPHRGTTYVDVTYCYKPTDRVAWWSIGQSACHSSELCKNGWTDRDAVWDLDSGGPKKACIRWGCHLANNTEPYMCGGDAASWQITLTTLTTTVIRGSNMACTQSTRPFVPCLQLTQQRDHYPRLSYKSCTCHV